MQHTFQLPASHLNSDFIKAVQALFGEQEVRIIVEDIKKEKPADQKELYKKSLELRERFKNVKVDPTLDLSSLANEVNL